MKKIMKITAFLGACLMVTSCDALAGLGLGGSSKEIKNELVKQQKYEHSVKGSKFQTTYMKDGEKNFVMDMVEDEKYDDVIMTSHEQSSTKESIYYPDRKDPIETVKYESMKYEYKYDSDNEIIVASMESNESEQGPKENATSTIVQEALAVQQKKKVLYVNELTKTYYSMDYDIEEAVQSIFPSIVNAISDLDDIMYFDEDGHGTEYYVDDHLYTIVFEEEEEENNYDYFETSKYTGIIQISFEENVITVLGSSKSEESHTDWETDIKTVTIEEEILEMKVQLKDVKLKAPDIAKYTELEMNY